MSKSKDQTDWKIIQRIDVGVWKTGYLVTDALENLRLLVTVDKEQFGARDSPSFISETLSGINVHKIADLDRIYNDESKLFLARMNALANKQHENLSQVFSIQSSEKGYPTAVMEYWEGEPVTGKLHHAPLSIYLAHFKQIFEALAFLHEHGMFVINWDPKFVTTNLIKGATKITSVWNIHTKDEVMSNKFHFNPLYAAPEVLLGKPPTEKSDLYSVAVMMLEAWRGGAPIFRETRSGRHMGLVEQGLQREEEPKAMFREISHELAPAELGDDFVLNMLKKNPEERRFGNAFKLINYLVNTWPETAKPANELYGGIMTTVRV